MAHIEAITSSSCLWLLYLWIIGANIISKGKAVEESSKHSPPVEPTPTDHDNDTTSRHIIYMIDLDRKSVV